MPSGLVALLDDVAMIARAAAASADDVAAGASLAGAKAAGVVIDDAAVTPAYVQGFTPDRELPVIWKIAKGSLRNKLVILLPLALLLSEFLPGAITPMLMLGGLYLCFEGAEKLIEKLEQGGDAEDEGGVAGDAASFENQRVTGAIRTDLILSAEIMAIALAEVSGSPVVERAVILALVGVAITALVYGVVGLIVKLDDIGLVLARGREGVRRRLGRFLLHATPGLLTVLSSIGVVAMLWVGGGILIHGAHELGWHAPSDLAHDARHALIELVGIRPSGGAGAALGWLAYALLSALAGLAVGVGEAGLLHMIRRLHGR